MKCKHKSGTIQLILMVLISLLTQLVVVGKSATVASLFGVGADIDAYNAVHSITNFVFSFVSSGITTVLIPAYLQKKKQESIDTFLTLMYLFCLFLVAVSCFLRYPILKAFSSGQNGFIEIGCSIFLIMMMSQFFNIVIGVATAYFQISDKFNIPKVCTLLSNICLLGLLIFDSNVTIYKYALYTSITTIANAVVQIAIAIVFKYRYSIKIRINNPEVIEMIRIFLPTVFSAGLYQINLLTDSFVSSRLGEGQISILSYSNQIITLVNALLITNIITYLYPKITAACNCVIEKQQEKLFNYIYFGEAIMGLLIVGFFAVGREFTMLLFQHGKFSGDETTIVYRCICLYMVGFPINIMRDLVYRFFYAKGNTTETFKNSVIASLANFVISIILSYIIGIYGVILGTLLSSLLSATMVFVRMLRNYGLHYSIKKFGTENIKILICTVVTVLMVMLVKKAIPMKVIGSIILYGCLSIFMYLILLKIMKSKSISVKI